MKYTIQQLICFGLLNYVFTFPNDLFDELWQVSAPQASETPIKSQPTIKALPFFIREPKLTSGFKVEPDEKQFDGRCQNESALKGTLKIKREPHYGAVNVQVYIRNSGTVKIEHEFEQNNGSQKVEEKPKLIKVEPVEVVAGDEPRLKMILPLSKSARKIRARSKMPQNESFEEANCSEESEEAYNHSSNETFWESNYSESEDFKELNHTNDQQNSRKRICHSEEEKHEIVNKFLEMKQTLQTMKDEFKRKGKYSTKEWTQIDEKIAKHLNVSRSKIYKWKKELGIDQKKAELKLAGLKNSYNHEIGETVAKELGLDFKTNYNWKRELGQTRPNYPDDEKLKIVKKLMQMKSERSGENKKSCKEIDKEITKRFGVDVRTINRWKKAFGLNQNTPKNKRKILVEKFDQMKAELKRDGFKNSYKNELDKTVAKELGLSFRTIFNWQREFGQTKPQKSHSEQKELMKRYYEIKGQNPKIRDVDIVKILKIGKVTLYKWKKQFKRQQFHTNSVDGHSVEENAAANVQEIGNSNLGSV